MATQKEKAQKYDEQLQRSKLAMQKNREAKKNAGLKQYTIWSKAMPKSVVEQGSKIGIAIITDQALAYYTENNRVPFIYVEDGKLRFSYKELVPNANPNDSKGGAVQPSPTAKANKS